MSKLQRVGAARLSVHLAATAKNGPMTPYYEAPEKQEYASPKSRSGKFGLSVTPPDVHH